MIAVIVILFAFDFFAQRCSAEVDPTPYQTDKKKILLYRDVGTAGKVTLKATRPGVGGPVYVDHFPSLGMCTYERHEPRSQIPRLGVSLSV